MTKKKLYRLTYVTHWGSVCEIYVRNIGESEMYGFIEIEGFIFGENSSLVIDPAEERLKNEFAGVTRSYIPWQAVVRIDLVEKEGVVKVMPLDKNNVTTLSANPYLSVVKPEIPKT